MAKDTMATESMTGVRDAQTPLVSVRDRIRNNNDSLSSILARLNRLNDSLAGNAVQPDSPNSDGPVPIGLLPEMNDALEINSEFINKICDALVTLEALI